MAKNFKINIKNAQLAEAIHLSDIKKKVALKKEQKTEEKESPSPKASDPQPIAETESHETPVSTAQGAGMALSQTLPGEELPSDAPKMKARARSAFDGPKGPAQTQAARSEEIAKEAEPIAPPPEKQTKTPLELAEERMPEIKTPLPSSAPSEPEGSKSQEIKGQDVRSKEKTISPLPTPREAPKAPAPPLPRAPLFRSPRREGEYRPPFPQKDGRGEIREPRRDAPRSETKPGETRPIGTRPPQREYVSPFALQKKASPEGLAKLQASQKERLGPTGRHISDIKPPESTRPRPPSAAPAAGDRPRPRRTETTDTASTEKKNLKPAKTVFKDFKPPKKTGQPQVSPSFDSRDRQGLRQGESEESARRRRRAKLKGSPRDDAQTVRPTTLKVRPPISIKDFASELKLKASELIAKLFLQGTVVTLNDLLEDTTTIQYIGHEFGCEVTIDTSEEQRIRITGLSIQDEIEKEEGDVLELRAPVVTFMGHVDHGKTSLIDAIRKSNRVSQEAGAITQHIGAFKCSTAVGDITILDTPGHEAFSAMRARGAEVTDIVVLVVAGDEGMKQQTVEALQHAKTAGVTIVVAINKCDKPNFNAETVYRQLSENDLLPEAWGGQIITVNCSAVTGEGIPQLLEMLAIQAEVLELKANPNARARGSVIESEMHKGMGIVATILVQNGTLRKGDSIVFDTEWARVKTMKDERGKDLAVAPPSTPVSITGLSGLPQAGQEFIVVKDEKEAREIAETRSVEKRQKSQLLNKRTMDSFLQQGQGAGKKTLRLVLRADVQGSLEALKSALLKITSSKVDVDIVFTGIGEISESDVQLAAASKAVIIGFHNSIESHAEALAKEMTVEVRLHDIIYHAIDDVKVLMAGQLEKLAQEVARGSATVLQTFQSSHVGIIAGCMVNDGSVHRNFKVVAKRKGAVVWKGSISSLKRLKEDVREVQKGFECGIVLDGFSDIQPDDILEFHEIIYITQEL